MLNTEDFVKRLELIFEYYGLTGASFADKIGIQRSSLSHLLSGRNKPSLEFVMKIISVLPEVEFDWILNGVGAFPKNSFVHSVKQPEIKTATPTLLFDDIVEEKLEVKNKDEKTIEQSSNYNLLQTNFQNNKAQAIAQIVIFYTDGTFKPYTPN